MICSLKSSIVILAAALAIAGTSASALAAEFHSSAEHPIISVTQTTPLQFNVTKESKFFPISCSTVKGTGTWGSTTSKALSFQPIPEGCKDSIERATHVTMNGCQYSLTATAGSGSTHTGQMAIECPEGKAITTVITTPGNIDCVVRILPQTGRGTVHYEAKENDVSATFQIGDITSTGVSGSFFTCATPIGHYAAGTLTGALTITAANTAGESQLLTVS